MVGLRVGGWPGEGQEEGEGSLTAWGNACRATMIRHGRKVPKLNRKPNQRNHMLRSLTTQLLEYGRIKTTRARAKALRSQVDWVITMAKKGRQHHKKAVKGWLWDNDLVDAVFEDAPTRYADREGGYTRIQRTLPRRGDNADMVYIELV